LFNVLIIQETEAKKENRENENAQKKKSADSQPMRMGCNMIDDDRLLSAVRRKRH